MEHASHESPTTPLPQDLGMGLNGVDVAAQEVRANLQKLDQRLRDLCREHPLAVLGGALAAGFVIGRWIARR